MTALQQWVDQLSERPLPVWRGCRDALLGLVDGGNYNGAALIRAAAHDPLLCAQLLRAANAGKSGGSIATLEQASVMLGAGPMARVARELPALEERPQVQLEALRQLQRRAFHVGYLARELTRRNRDMRYDDAYYAGLLHNLGELALRAHSPAVVAQIGRAAHREGLSRAEAAQKILGFDIPSLSAALARHWRLPPLVQAVLDRDHTQDHRTELVSLAIGVLHGGPALLQPEVEDTRLQRVGAILGEKPAQLGAVIFKAAAEAAAHLGTDNRVPAPTGGWIDLFPEEPVDSHEDEPPPAVSDAQPAAMARFEAKVRAAPPGQLTLQGVLEEFAQALREGLAMDRVVVALLTADHATLRGRFFRGIAADAPLHRFEFARTESNVFTRLLERPAAVWMRPGASEELKALVTEPVRAIVECGEFVAQSLFLRGRPVGLCYADRASSGRTIAGDDYARFRQHCAGLIAHLSRLTEARKPG